MTFHVDSDIGRILKTDGIPKVHLGFANQEKVDIPALINQYGREQSWSHVLIDTPSNSATLIAQLPGEGNRPHLHKDWDEWWYIIEGTFLWTIEDRQVKAETGDLIFVERNRRHEIQAVGHKLAVRLAVSRADIDHHYD